MIDYDMWYDGQIIGNTTGADDKEALKNARDQYGDLVTVSPTRGTREQADAAMQESIDLRAAE